MNRQVIYIFSLITILLVGVCTDSATPNYQELGWKDLRPYEERVVDEGKSWRSLDVVDGWARADFGQEQGLLGRYSGTPLQAYSAGVVAEIDGKNVRVPGFIVPIEFEAGNLITEFFLVPSFGACFHNPPPPPNQTIYVTSADPIEYESIYDPVWVMGVIKTEQTGNDVAAAAYGMDLHDIETYTE
ncbi:MAG: hypothetical protein ACJAY3_000430 [Neolewinella sp.]|jgi:hypothetical protein